MTEISHDVTQLLKRWKEGEAGAADEVFRLLYDDLKAVAARQFHGERMGHTLQPTAIAHEAYLRLVKAKSLEARDRGNFLALMARVTRQVLVDHGRDLARQKRGGKAARVELHEDMLQTALSPAQFIDLDRALAELAEVRDQTAQVVEMRFFGGMSAEEISSELGVGTATVQRNWKYAKAWLHRRLEEG